MKIPQTKKKKSTHYIFNDHFYISRVLEEQISDIKTFRWQTADRIIIGLSQYCIVHRNITLKKGVEDDAMV